MSSGVVIRCQHCGTTQATLGECDTCHEGQTRYFCPNHTPGRWLDGPACSACGARLGVAPTVAPPSSNPPKRTPPPARAAPTSRTDAPRRPRAAPPDARSDDETWREEAPFEEPALEEVEDAPVASWRAGRRMRPRDIIDEIIRMRAMRGGLREPAARAPVPVVNIFGCLRRLVITGVILAVLAALALYSVFSSGILSY